MAAAPTRLDPVTSYADQVVRKKVPAGGLVRLACERHLTDLKAGSMRGLRWDAGAAERAISFFWYLRHSKGEWAGTRFPWQQFDEGDDWTSEAAWRKANPNYGISVKADDMRRLCEQAKRMPSKQNAFKRLRLTVWTQQVDRWISLELWDAQAGIVDEVKLQGRTCYGGLDLASVSDLVAWVMVFPDPDDPDLIEVVPRFWCPEARLHADDNRYKDQYQAWQRAGVLKTTPGTAIDYDYVKKQILEDASTFRVVDLNIDRLFQAHQLSMQLLGEGMQVAPMGMGFLSMAAPMKEFERSLLAGKVRHGGHPVLRWMADNMAVAQDAAGNFKPDKKSSQGKIDGMVALVMAIDRAQRHRTGSVYDKRGIRTA